MASVHGTISFLGVPTLSASRYIGRRSLAGLMFLEENTGFTRQLCWRDGAWKTDHHQNAVFRDKRDIPGFLVEGGSSFRRRLRVWGVCLRTSEAEFFP
jgi:hypothetical protein